MKDVWLVMSFIAVTCAQLLAEEIPREHFRLWGTHQDQPYYEGSGFIIPVGQAGVDNYLAAQGKRIVRAKAFSFYGCFKGGANAPDGTSEQAVFLATDVKTWKGNEFGFVKTLSDNVLKGYVQTPTQYKTQVISRGNSGLHTYKAIVDEKEQDLVHFYIDEKYILSIRADQPQCDFSDANYIAVGTTRRATSPDWDAKGQQIEVYNFHIW